MSIYVSLHQILRLVRRIVTLLETDEGVMLYLVR